MRTLGALTLAVLLNGGLFIMMEAMVGAPQAPRTATSEAIPLAFIAFPREEQTRFKDRRRLPPKPERMERFQARLETTALTDAAPRLEQADSAVMDISRLLAAVPGGVAVGNGLAYSQRSPDGPTVVDVRTLSAIAMLPPQYPRRAAENGIEGWVTVLFRVDERGFTHDAIVEEAQPPGMFEQAALAAVARWRFRVADRDADAPVLYARARINFGIDAPADDG